MINKHKLHFEVDQNIQIEHWITQLKIIKNKDSSEILKTFINMKKIITRMESANYNMQEKEKL